MARKAKAQPEPIVEELVDQAEMDSDFEMDGEEFDCDYDGDEEPEVDDYAEEIDGCRIFEVTMKKRTSNRRMGYTYLDETIVPVAWYIERDGLYAGPGLCWNRWYTSIPSFSSREEAAKARAGLKAWEAAAAEEEARVALQPSVGELTVKLQYNMRVAPRSEELALHLSPATATVAYGLSEALGCTPDEAIAKVFAEIARAVEFQKSLTWSADAIRQHRDSLLSHSQSGSCVSAPPTR